MNPNLLIVRDALEAAHHVRPADYYPRGVDGPLWPADPTQLATLLGRAATPDEVALWEGIVRALLDPDTNRYESNLADSSGFDVTETPVGWLVREWTTVSGRVTGGAWIISFEHSGYKPGAELLRQVNRGWGELRIAELIREDVQGRAGTSYPAVWGVTVIDRGHIVGGDPWPPERTLAGAQEGAR